MDTRFTTSRAIALSAEFGFIIALPLVILGEVGKYLDSRYHQNFFLLIGILLAIASSTLYLYRRFKQLIDETRTK